MMTTFRTLFTISVNHGYYRAGCRDFDFILPAATYSQLNNGRLLAKVHDGTLHVLYESNDTGDALINMNGNRLRFGMRLVNPLFSNFTVLETDTTPLYRNAASAGSLDQATAVTMTGRFLSHAFSKATRPVTVTVAYPAGQVVKTDTITAANDRATASFDLSGKDAGMYTLVESYPEDSGTTIYYFDDELMRSGIFGVIEITIDAGFYAVPAAFVLTFNAKEELLKYYVVASNLSTAEFNHLSVSDHGYAEDERPSIDFTRVAEEEFTAADLQPAMIAKAGERVALFASRTPVPRREAARTKIQLSRNNDVLIKHLPQPGADRTNGDMIIHIAKP